VISLLFNGQSNPILDEILNKLDDVLNKLDSISKSIETAILKIDCVNLQTDYRNKIRNKLKRLSDTLLNYFKSPNKAKIKYKSHVWN
jgi:hypothetical protein